MKGHIRERGRRSWAIVVDIGRDEGGKRRQKWHSFKGTKRDAQKELNRLLHELNTGAYVEPVKLTVAEFLHQWIEGYARQAVSGRSFDRYQAIVEKHLIPALGHYHLTQLKPLQVQRHYAEAMASGRLDGSGGLSAQTVLHHHRVFKEALKYAVRWQLLGRNPLDAVDPPRPRPVEMKTLDEAQTATLLRAAEGNAFHVPILIAVTTGLRRGEILGIRWKDVDLEARTLAVRQTVELSRAGLGFKEPKTPKSRRSIVIPPLLVEALRTHKLEQAERRLELGPAYGDLDLVCAAADGGPTHPDKLSRAFKEALVRAGLPKVRFHDLRHGHASHLLREGVHPKVVSERLGHATVAITLDRYSHVLPGLQDEAAMKIDVMLKRSLAAVDSN